MKNEQKPRTNDRVAYILIVVGLIFLLINLDILTLTIFSSFGKFWPLILVSVGFWMLLKRKP